MINGAFANEQAVKFVSLAKQKAGADIRARVKFLMENVTQRPATELDVDRGLKLIEDLQKTHGHSADKALETFALAALNLNEFLYLD